jgi:hypothetical protein
VEPYSLFGRRALLTAERFSARLVSSRFYQARERWQEHLYLNAIGKGYSLADGADGREGRQRSVPKNCPIFGRKGDSAWVHAGEHITRLLAISSWLSQVIIEFADVSMFVLIHPCTILNTDLLFFLFKAVDRGYVSKTML